MKFDYLKLANIIKERREELNISTRKLGEEIGISHSEISRFENGIKPSFNFIPFVKMCEKLDLDVNELLQEVGLIKEKIDKKYLVKFANVDENYFEIRAKNEKEAAEIVAKFVIENKIIDLNINESIDIEVEKIEEENNNSYDNNKDKTCIETPCDSCKYYCPFCGECTLE